MLTNDRICEECKHIRYPKDITYEGRAKCMLGCASDTTAITINGDYHEHMIVDEKFGCVKFSRKEKELKNMDHKEITREEFMAYYRSDRYSEELSPDDKMEVFMGSIHGSSDLTKSVLEELLSDYGNEDLIITQRWKHFHEKTSI